MQNTAILGVSVSTELDPISLILALLLILIAIFTLVAIARTAYNTNQMMIQFKALAHSQNKATMHLADAVSGINRSCQLLDYLVQAKAEELKAAAAARAMPRQMPSARQPHQNP